jgi:hypothetical protein
MVTQSEVERPFRGRERYVVSGKVPKIGREHKRPLVVPGKDHRTGISKVHAWGPTLDLIEHGGNERRSDRHDIHPRHESPQCVDAGGVILKSVLRLRDGRFKSDETRGHRAESADGPRVIDITPVDRRFKRSGVDDYRPSH